MIKQLIIVSFIIFVAGLAGCTMYYGGGKENRIRMSAVPIEKVNIHKSLVRTGRLTEQDIGQIENLVARVQYIGLDRRDIVAVDAVWNQTTVAARVILRENYIYLAKFSGKWRVVAVRSYKIHED